MNLMPQKTKGLNRFVVMACIICFMMVVAIVAVIYSSNDYVYIKIESRENDKLEREWPRGPPFKKIEGPLSSIDYIRINALAKHNFEIMMNYNLECVSPAIYNDDSNLFILKNHTLFRENMGKMVEEPMKIVPASHPHEINDINERQSSSVTYNQYFNCINLAILPYESQVVKFIALTSLTGKETRKLMLSTNITISCQLWNSNNENQDLDISVPFVNVTIDDPHTAYCIQHYFY